MKSHWWLPIFGKCVRSGLILTLFVLPFTQSVSCWISSKPRWVICSSSSSPYKCGTHVFRNRYSSSVRFFGMLNQNSGRNLFLPYDMTYVGNGIVLPIGLPMRNLKYSGGSAQARAGLGINSVCDRAIEEKKRKKEIDTTKLCIH